MSETAITKKGSLSFGRVLSAIGPLIGLVFVYLLFSIITPLLTHFQFAKYQTFELILLQTAVVAMAALGMTMIIISAGIDLTVGSNIALCAVVIALLVGRKISLHIGGSVVILPAMSPLMAAVCGIGASGLVGLLISILITKLRISPFIVTLGLMGAVRGVAQGLANDTTVYAPPSWLDNIMANGTFLAPAGVWLTILMAIFVALLLNYTRVGRHIFAVGSNEQTARLCGVNVDGTKIFLYSLAGLLAGLAGLLQFSYTHCGDSTTATGLELSAIASVVIGGASLSGGQGSIFGTLVGAMIMTTIQVGGTSVGLSNWVQEIVTGAIIIFAVALDQWRHRKSAV
jgi:ribose/xylose/arabinose/galactoside ABC-type transport system permease subunit